MTAAMAVRVVNVFIVWLLVGWRRLCGNRNNGRSRTVFPETATVLEKIFKMR
jgi:hypothetical protein